jgi:hypothetical protein
MKKDTLFTGSTSRRSFLTKGTVAAGAATMSASVLGGAAPVFGHEHEFDDGGGRPNRGDIAILRFLQALETIEADLWRQYTELAGPSAATGTLGLSPNDVKDQNGQPFPSGVAALYIGGLEILDGDMPQYILDNTDDEFSHEVWLKNYLASKGADIVELHRFANLAPSQVTGVPNIGRITNLTQLSVDTSWWTRYRSDNKNPDLGDSFENAIPSLAVGQHTAIPRTNADLIADPGQESGVGIHTQAIAFTAGFHFATIEQGGSSLYPSLAQRVTDVEVLRVLLSIGPTETMHFQTWQDKAGNITQITDTDSGFPGSTGATVTFPDLNSGKDPNDAGQTSPDPGVADQFQTNLIMPEPTFFLHKRLGPISIIRPTQTKDAAKNALQGLIDSGLFIGHTSKSGKSDGLLEFLRDLAEDADQARR